MTDDVIKGNFRQSDLYGWVTTLMGLALLLFGVIDQYAWLGSLGLGAWLVTSGKPPGHLRAMKGSAAVGQKGGS